MDIRYQLIWNFGGFLQDVVCRLGTNDALDASSDALVATHKGFCAGYADPSPEQLVKYSRGLYTLRQAISDPGTVHSIETLCAIMILMITEVYSLTLHFFAHI